MIGSRLAALVLGALFLACAPVAWAHRPYLRAAIGPVSGSASPIVISEAGRVEIAALRGGVLELSLDNVTPLSAPGNVVRIEARVNGVPQVLTFPFDIEGGRVELAQVFSLDLHRGDLIEIKKLQLLDADGHAFGTLGTPPGNFKPILGSALVYDIDSTSDVRFSRGGDTNLLPHIGKFNVGFDRLLDPAGDELSNTGNFAEIDVLIDGIPHSFTLPFGIKGGKSTPGGRPSMRVPVTAANRIEIQRLEVFDPLGERIATLGIRILEPR